MTVDIPEPFMLIASVAVALGVCLILWVAVEFRERSRKP